MDTGLLVPIVSALAIHPLTPSILYAGTVGGGVFKSTNGGALWTPLSTGLTNTVVAALVIDPLTPTLLYAGTVGGGVFVMQQQFNYFLFNVAGITVAPGASGSNTIVATLSAGLSQTFPSRPRAFRAKRPRRSIPPPATPPARPR
jgi:hypothetical protein